MSDHTYDPTSWEPESETNRRVEAILRRERDELRAELDSLRERIAKALGPEYLGDSELANNVGNLRHHLDSLRVQLARAQEALKETRYMLRAEDRPGWVKVNTRIRAQVEEALSPGADSWLAERDEVQQQKGYAQAISCIRAPLDAPLMHAEMVDALAEHDARVRAEERTLPTTAQYAEMMRQHESRLRAWLAEKLAAAEAKGRAEALKEAATRADTLGFDCGGWLRSLAKLSEPTSTTPQPYPSRK